MKHLGHHYFGASRIETVRAETEIGAGDGLDGAEQQRLQVVVPEKSPRFPICASPEQS